MDFRKFRVYVNDEAEGKGFNSEEAFPVLAMREGKADTELLLPDTKKRLIWVKMKNVTFMGLTRV